MTLLLDGTIQDKPLSPGETQKNLYDWLTKVEKKPGWNTAFGRECSRLDVGEPEA